MAALAGRGSANHFFFLSASLSFRPGRGHLLQHLSLLDQQFFSVVSDVVVIDDRIEVVPFVFERFLLNHFSRKYRARYLPRDSIFDVLQ